MKRALAVTTLLILAAQMPVVRAQRQDVTAADPRDTLLAALGRATLDCRQTVGPDLYETSGGVLARTFRSCTTGRSRALEQIDGLLGVQFSEEGRSDGLAEFYVARWDAFVRRFASAGVRDCPKWTLLNVMDAPTMESVERAMRDGRPYAEHARYRVESRSCGSSRTCAVRAAAVCAGGFGRGFVVELDERGGRVEVDPAWWLLDYEYRTDESNPFKIRGYYHPMSYWGPLPGALYGSPRRVGEACSSYHWGMAKHYIDGVLIPVDCGGGFICVSYCYWSPPPAQQPPGPTF